MTSSVRLMIQKIQAKIEELNKTIEVLQSLDDGPKSQWEHVLAALDQLGHPANVKTLVATMQSNGWATDSKNPLALLTTTLRNKEKNGQVMKMGRGLWGKCEWAVAGGKLANKVRKSLEKQ